MADIEINRPAHIGLIRDQSAYKLPLEAWSEALNIRYEDGSALRFPGWEQIFGTPNIAPSFAVPVQNASQTWWLYTSLTKASVYNGSSHTDITRAVGGDYTPSNHRDWNGTILGGIPILNSGADDPQYWAAYSTGQRLQDLSNWPANTQARVIRAFGSQLVAANLTESGVNLPHRVKWSSRAVPGSLPASWDENDATVDTGETDLADVNSGLILDMLPLAGRMYIYKDESTTLMRRIGGRAIFDFDPFLETSGALAQRCVTITGDGVWHVVMTQDDIIKHNGREVSSIVDKRLRRAIFNELDTANFRNAFLFTHPLKKEVWICYPTNGNTLPDKAVVWNYGEPNGPLSEIDGLTFVNASAGIVETASGTTWDATVGTWDAQVGPWNFATRRRVVLSSPGNTKFYRLDSGNSKDTTVFAGTLQREGLTVLGRDNSGEPVVDFHRAKQLNRVWLKMSGGPVNVRIGSQELVDGVVTWSTAQVFDPVTDLFVDEVASGLAVALEITGDVPFELEGTMLEIFALGKF